MTREATFIQRRSEAASRIKVAGPRHRKPENRQRYGNREDAIPERLNPPGFYSVRMSPAFVFTGLFSLDDGNQHDDNRNHQRGVNEPSSPVTDSWDLLRGPKRPT